MAEPAVIARPVMISGGMNTKPWLVAHIQTIDGMDMISLKKSDPGLTMFVAGKRRGLNTRFLDKLKAMRTKATFDACNDSVFDVPLSDRRAKAKFKLQCISAGIPSIVEVMLPAAAGFAPQKIKVEASLDVRKTLSVELKGSVLDHIGELMRNSEPEDTPVHARPRRGKGVQWVAGRRVFIATRTREGQPKRMKTFRPEDDGDEELAKDDAMHRAVEWASRAEDTSDDEDENVEESEDEDVDKDEES